MPIDFSVEPEFQEQLDWIRDFVDTADAESLDPSCTQELAGTSFFLGFAGPSP